MLKFKLYLFYSDYGTRYTTYINHALWRRCLRSDGLRVAGNRSARRKPTCVTWLAVHGFHIYRISDYIKLMYYNLPVLVVLHRDIVYCEHTLNGCIDPHVRTMFISRQLLTITDIRVIAAVGVSKSVKRQVVNTWQTRFSLYTWQTISKVSCNNYKRFGVIVGYNDVVLFVCLVG